MKLPEMTPLQFAAVSLLFAGPKTADELRDGLCRWEGRRNRASFAALMQRMDTAGYVVRDYRPGLKQGTAGSG